MTTWNILERYPSQQRGHLLPPKNNYVKLLVPVVSDWQYSVRLKWITLEKSTLAPVQR